MLAKRDTFAVRFEHDRVPKRNQISPREGGTGQLLLLLLLLWWSK